MRKTLRNAILVTLFLFLFGGKLCAFEVTGPAADANEELVNLYSGNSASAVLVDAGDYPVVKLAAQLFADDVRKVTGQSPEIINQPSTSTDLVIAGTLGHSPLIDKLIAAGKIRDLEKIKGRWEATLYQIVKQPFPGVQWAFVIVGSDRRGTAYGLMRLSEKIGVSPWSWWADVPTTHHENLVIGCDFVPEVDAPAVKYRGIFINDEDWGINPWASKTFDPAFGNIGPKTYEKVFELMLRLRLNLFWPAMHGCTTEFGSIPENAALADRYGIVAGSSHCEPMLFNNVHWNEKEKGPWNYSLNRPAILATWEEVVKARGDKEAVWTLGIRGIHDAGMEKPPADNPNRMKLLGDVFRDQRELINHQVTNGWGPVAQCFIPYKEVLPLYDAGLEIPKEATIIWVDDNFGYIRRLGSQADSSRPGGAGLYWHLSYYGAPHSYTWINTTPPALMWEEFQKAWENDARTLWVINVGDIKPMEIGIDYFSRLAWNPAALGADSQPQFLQSFAKQQFGKNLAQPVASLLGEFYRLGTIRKPELMNREWALSLPADEASHLREEYGKLLKDEEALAALIPQDARDAYFEMLAFPAQVLGESGLIFMADRAVQYGDHVPSNQNEIEFRRASLEKLVIQFNETTAGGKWKYMMPGLETGKDLTKWSSQVRWPWGEPASTAPVTSTATNSPRIWHDAASATLHASSGANTSRASWVPVAGLGSTGHAVALKPTTPDFSWEENDPNAPTLEYEFQSKEGDSTLLIDFLPTFRIHPGMQLRVGISIDHQPPIIVEVPGSNGKEDENGPNRNQGIRNNYVRAQVPLPGLTQGKHSLKIHAIDPGAVIDRFSLTEEN